MEVLAILPARGGSKGIPGKNLSLVGGVPLITHSIRQALLCGTVGRVVVSTDDEAISRVSREGGAEVVERPANISLDDSSTELALQHVLENFRQEGYCPDLVVFLQVTSPLRTPQDIDGAVRTLVEGNLDSVFSGCRVEGFVWEETEGGVSPLNYDPRNRPRRQELDRWTVEENGSIYVFKPWVLAVSKSRLGGRIGMYQMSRLDSFQIDVPEDIEIVNSLLSGGVCRG